MNAGLLSVIVLVKGHRFSSTDCHLERLIQKNSREEIDHVDTHPFSENPHHDD